MKHKSVRQSLCLSLLSLMVLIALSASKANAYTLAYYLEDPNRSITVADKEFYGFSDYHALGSGVDPVEASQIEVSGITRLINNVQEYGLFFQGVGLLVVGGEGQDLRFGFNVRTIDGEDRIIDDYLEMNGGTRGLGQASISETISNESGYVPALDADGNPRQGSLLVYQKGSAEVTTDIAYFLQPQDWLHINKDVHVFGGNAESCANIDCAAFISDFYQLFSQTGGSHDVPEPSSMILLGLGLAGMRIARRKRESK